MLIGMGIGIGAVALASVQPHNKRLPAALLRPPGAKIGEFESRCIRCAACINVCPTQGLQPTLLEGGWDNVMTPMLIPRLGYCEISCKLCTEVCPTEAIPRLTMEEKQRSVIGLAWINRDRCLPWAYMTSCIVCEEACPLPEKAISLQEDQVVDQEGKLITLQRPIISKEMCIGCGVCEYQCPMGGEAAIRVYSQTEIDIQPGSYW